MAEYIEKTAYVELSGYSRGNVEATLYYNAETGELADWDYDLSIYDIVRNDMEVYDDFPQQIDVEKD